MSGSTARRLVRGPYDAGRHPGGPNHLKCRWCGVALTGRKISFCGSPCVHEWRLRSDPNYVRGLLKKRDHGVCALCGMDTLAVKARIERALRETEPARKAISGWGENFIAKEVLTPMVRRWCRLLSFINRHKVANKYSGRSWYEDYRVRSLWDADHILQVKEGGGECGLDNYRTLCLWCHKRATALYAKERAERRKVAASTNN